MKRVTGWERWKEAPAGERDLDGAIGELLRKAGRAPAVSEVRLRRVERRLLGSRRERRWTMPIMRWAMAGGMLLLSAGGLAAGVVGPRRVYEWAALVVSGEPSQTPAERAVGARERKKAASPANAIEAAPAAALVAPPPEEPGAAAPSAVAVAEPATVATVSAVPSPRPRETRAARPVRRTAVPSTVAPPAAAAPAEGPAPAAVAPPAPLPAVPSGDAPAAMGAAHAGSQVPAEAALIGQAITRLRKNADTEGALRALDEYERRFPSGSLRGEAALVRIDALLAGDQIDKALRVAEASPNLPLERRRELQLIDAEHLAGRDCAVAVSRFDFLLRGAVLPADMRERALYGRANCHVRLGHRAAAQRDLHAYLAEYPAGRFAGTVKRALRDLEP